MSKMRQSFIHWYNNEFKTTSLYANMEAVTEGSPFHQERNVGVHTDMVVTEYLARAAFSDFTDFDDLRGAFAAAFHDVGKPMSEIIKSTEERGEYKAFHGHEQRSARLWEAFALENRKMLEDRFCFDVMDIYLIAVMIEHHVPWRMRDKRKLDGVFMSTLKAGGPEGFSNLLMADTMGRICVDAEVKEKESQDWIFKEIVSRLGWLIPDDDEVTKRLVMPIGPSGCGKSTRRREIEKEEGAVSFSLDDLRLGWYKSDDYEDAWQQSVDDDSFFPRARQAFTELLRENHDVVFVDNTNLSRKHRRFYIDEARRRGYSTEAELFMVPEKVLMDRQVSRTDKTIADWVVRRQWIQIQYPMIYSEFDRVSCLMN